MSQQKAQQVKSSQRPPKIYPQTNPHTAQSHYNPIPTSQSQVAKSSSSITQHRMNGYSMSDRDSQSQQRDQEQREIDSNTSSVDENFDVDEGFLIDIKAQTARDKNHHLKSSFVSQTNLLLSQEHQQVTLFDKYSPDLTSEFSHSVKQLDSNSHYQQRVQTQSQKDAAYQGEIVKTPTKPLVAQMNPEQLYKVASKTQMSHWSQPDAEIDDDTVIANELRGSTSINNQELKQQRKIKTQESSGENNQDRKDQKGGPTCQQNDDSALNLTLANSSSQVQTIEAANTKNSYPGGKTNLVPAARLQQQSQLSTKGNTITSSQSTKIKTDQSFSHLDRLAKSPLRNNGVPLAGAKGVGAGIQNIRNKAVVSQKKQVMRSFNQPTLVANQLQFIKAQNDNLAYLEGKSFSKELNSSQTAATYDQQQELLNSESKEHKEQKPLDITEQVNYSSKMKILKQQEDTTQTQKQKSKSKAGRNANAFNSQSKQMSKKIGFNMKAKPLRDEALKDSKIPPMNQTQSLSNTLNTIPYKSTYQLPHSDDIYVQKNHQNMKSHQNLPTNDIMNGLNNEIDREIQEESLKAQGVAYMNKTQAEVNISNLENSKYSLSSSRRQQETKARSRNSNYHQNKTLSAMQEETQILPVMRSINVQAQHKGLLQEGSESQANFMANDSVDMKQLNYTFSQDTLKLNNQRMDQLQLKFGPSQGQNFLSPQKSSRRYENQALKANKDNVAYQNEQFKKQIIQSQLNIYKNNKKSKTKLTAKSPHQLNGTQANSTFSRLLESQEKWIKQKNNYQPPDLYEQELSESCTFKPNLAKSPIRETSRSIDRFNPNNLNSATHASRTHEQFLEDQIRFEKLKDERLRQLRENFINDQLTKMQEKGIQLAKSQVLVASAQEDPKGLINNNEVHQLSVLAVGATPTQFRDRSRRKYKSNDFGGVFKGAESRSFQDGNSITQLDFMTRTKMFEHRREEKMQNLLEKYYGSHDSRNNSRSVAKNRLEHNQSVDQIVTRLYSNSKQKLRRQSSVHSQRSQKETPAINSKSLEYVTQKLHSDLEKMTSFLKVKDYLTYDDVMNLLSALGYTKNSRQSQVDILKQNQKSQENQLWQMMSDCNMLERIPIYTLKIFLTAIEGVFFKWMLKPEDKVTRMQLGKDAIYLRDQEHAGQIAKRFFNLLQNRRRFLDNERIQRLSAKRDHNCKRMNHHLYSSTHEMSSQHLHTRSQDIQSLNQVNQSLSSMQPSISQQQNFAESLILRGKAYEQNIELRRQKIIEEELAPCTFKPVINRQNSARALSISGQNLSLEGQAEIGQQLQDSVEKNPEKQKPNYQDRFVKLFSENPREKRSKDGRPVQDIEYELQKEQCTFAPITNHTKDKSQREKLQASYFQEDSQVQRRLNDQIVQSKSSLGTNFKLFSPPRKDLEGSKHSSVGTILSPKIMHKSSDLNSTCAPSQKQSIQSQIHPLISQPQVSLNLTLQSHNNPSQQQETAKKGNATITLVGVQKAHPKPNASRENSQQNKTLKGKQSRNLQSQSFQTSQKQVNKIDQLLNEKSQSKQETNFSAKSLQTQNLVKPTSINTESNINPSMNSPNQIWGARNSNPQTAQEERYQTDSSKPERNPSLNKQEEKKSKNLMSPRDKTQFGRKNSNQLQRSSVKPTPSQEGSRQNSQSRDPQKRVSVVNLELLQQQQLAHAVSDKVDGSHFTPRGSQQPNPISSPSQVMNQIPLLFLDVNLGNDRMQRIIINEGDNIPFIVEQFCRKHNLNPKKRMKLEKAIETQLAGHLHCIQEED